MSKVINTILSLTDKMSAPLRASAGAVKRQKEILEKTRNQIKKYEEQVVKNNAVLKTAQTAVKNLKKEYGANKDEIARLKATVEQHSNITSRNKKQMKENAEIVKNARARIEQLQMAQNKNLEATKKATSEIEKYKNENAKASEAIKKARDQAKKSTAIISNYNKKVAEAKKRVREWGKSAETSLDGAISKVKNITLAMASVVGGFAVKTGLGQAMDIEGYKMQLETATKSTEKAGKLMASAIKFANETPFTTGEVVESTAKMEAYGLSSQKWLKDVADMAGATNKSIDQATEAMADAVMGEFERLKEFGIKKEVVIAQATKKYGKAVVSGKRGEAKKREAIEATLQAIMQEKYKGGAEKQAKTLKGLWSTIVGVTQISLAKIIGITDKGTERQGSVYAKLKEQLGRVVAVLNRWQEDGTIDRIAAQATKAVEMMITFFHKLFNFVGKYKTVISTITIFVGTIYTLVKAYRAWQAVMVVVNTLMYANPIGLVIIGIAALAAGFYVLYEKSETFRKAISSMWETLKKVYSKAVDLFNTIKSIFGFEDKNINIKSTTEDITPESVKQKFIEKKESFKNPFEGLFTPTPTTNTSFNNKSSKSSIINSSSNTKTQENVIHIHGDVYGYDDFQKKVCEAFVKAHNRNSPNIA